MALPSQKATLDKNEEQLLGIILGLGQESLGIFEQHMTQRNYENYFEILGVTKI